MDMHIDVTRSPKSIQTLHEPDQTVCVFLTNRLQLNSYYR